MFNLKVVGSYHGYYFFSFISKKKNYTEYIVYKDIPNI